MDKAIILMSSAGQDKVTCEYGTISKTADSVRKVFDKTKFLDGVQSILGKWKPKGVKKGAEFEQDIADFVAASFKDSVTYGKYKFG